MSAQIAEYPAAYKMPAPFAFLSKPPPPPQKKRPSANTPLPAPPGGPLPQLPELHRPRSNTFNSIVSWAAHVQPGSPAPRSPHRRPSITSTTTTSSSPRRPSLTRRPSISRLNLSRRPSISHGRAPSGSFVHIIDIDTQSTTPSVANFDLTALGYTTLFVHLPKTPTTPSPLLRQYNRAGVPKTPASPAGVPLSASFAVARIPVPPVPQDKDTKRKGMKRFRSLSILRPKSSKGKPLPEAQAQALASPTKTTVSISTKPTKPLKLTSKLTATSPTSKSTSTIRSKESKAEIRSAHIAQRKRAKYAYVRPPPPLANELAMMQFADGGSLEANVRRVMEAQAKMAKGSGAASVGVADVYRDANGGVWWDADEELEYAHLLDGTAGAGMDKGVSMQVYTDADTDVDMDWEEFDAAEPLAAAAASTGGSTNILTHPSHLIPSNKEKENLPLLSTTTRRPSLTLSLSSTDSDLDPKYLLPLPENEDPRLQPIDDRVLASTRVRTGGAGMGMLLSLPARPRRRAMHLCKPGFLVGDGGAWGVHGGAGGEGSAGVKNATRGKGKARRRPAPLKLTSSNSSSVVALSNPKLNPPALLTPHILSPGGVEKTRKEFIADSFAPLPLPGQNLNPNPNPRRADIPPPVIAPATPNPATKPSKPFRMRGFSFFAISSRRGE